ncbi:hypothetical protein J1G18_22755 [Pseudomonas sp. MIS38]|uniref:hypothetical protein n=1 Tax=Pseudomonas sp. MIS38 TaxID=91465 RepID=UPI001CA7382F|nr:hypothetical protein [Pseudomonas sp. MIS38]MBY8960122.1 hypothetical protein [Pseudomonas sp. MIS38]
MLYHVAEQMESNQRVNARTAKLDTEALRKHDEQVRTRQFANPSSVDVETAIRAQIYLKYSQSLAFGRQQSRANVRFWPKADGRERQQSATS